jgi:hypothetical protein
MQIFEVENSEILSGGHKYRYGFNDYEDNPKLDNMVKKHFINIVNIGTEFGWKKIKEIVISRNHIFRLQLKKKDELISYDILHDVEKGNKHKVSYTILFNNRQFEYNNLKDCYNSLIKILKIKKSSNKKNTKPIELF